MKKKRIYLSENDVNIGGASEGWDDEEGGHVVLQRQFNSLKFVGEGEKWEEALDGEVLGKLLFSRSDVKWRSHKKKLVESDVPSERHCELRVGIRSMRKEAVLMQLTAIERRIVIIDFINVCTS